VGFRRIITTRPWNGKDGFVALPLPTRGATVRHMTIDPASDAVWLAYGASPAVHPARIAPLELER